MSAPNSTRSTTVTNCSCSTYDRTLLPGMNPARSTVDSFALHNRAPSQDIQQPNHWRPTSEVPRVRLIAVVERYAAGDRPPSALFPPHQVQTNRPRRPQPLREASSNAGAGPFVLTW